MPEESDLSERRHARDRALRRLKTLTVLFGVAMTALAGAVAGLAAATASGRKLTHLPPKRVTAASARRVSRGIPAPPPLAPVGPGSAPAAAPASPPAATQVQPVAVSGGS